ncbi:MAG: divergent polysaccharide deacetylase family protein [Arcobacteraceae bacterium]
MSNLKPKKTTKSSKKKNNPIFVRNILILTIIALVAIIIAFGSYIYITSTPKKQPVQTTTQEIKKEEIVEEKKDDLAKIDEEHKILDEKIETIKEDLKSKEEQQTQPIQDSKKEELLPTPKQYSNDYKNTPEVVLTEPKKPVIKTKKPKLAIVIDDVVYPAQVQALKSLGYPINMSFLPPTPDHPQSATIAQGLSHYMIHLPLEAMTFSKEEDHTLHVGDGINKIENRIVELKKLYPNAKYTNNHTGSKFTSDDESMDKLMSVLKKHNLIFLDSKTTSKTVAYKYAKKHHVPFLSRDVFLDNVQEFKAIQKQLRQAITFAKQRGYAIAIGHPYGATIDVLKSSAELLKNEVEVVYINEIPLL